MGYLPSEGSSLAECQASYDTHYRSGRVSYRRREQLPIIKGFMHTAGWTSGMRILEIGCGIGFQAQLLAHQGLQITAVDFSPVAIAQAKTRFKGALLCRDATQFTADNPFDGILFNDFSLFHYELQGTNRLGVDMDAFVKRVFSWLKPHGSILIKAPTDIEGIASNIAMDFDAMLRPYAGPLSHTSAPNLIIIVARGNAVSQQPEPTAETAPEAAPEPDVEPTPDPQPDEPEGSDGHGMGYPDPWGYGHKS